MFNARDQPPAECLRSRVSDCRGGSGNRSAAGQFHHRCSRRAGAPSKNTDAVQRNPWPGPGPDLKPMMLGRTDHAALSNLPPCVEQYIGDSLRTPLLPARSALLRLGHRSFTAADRVMLKQLASLRVR